MKNAGRSPPEGKDPQVVIHDALSPSQLSKFIYGAWQTYAARIAFKWWVDD